MFKRFKDGELFVNRIEAHPKVEFFVNDDAVNSVHHNRVVQLTGSAVPNGHIALSNLINVEPPPVPANFDESFEFAGGWDETVESIPAPVFSAIAYNEPFEFAGGWDETVDGIPTPSFGSVNFDEDFDSSWDGT